MNAGHVDYTIPVTLTNIFGAVCSGEIEDHTITVEIHYPLTTNTITISYKNYVNSSQKLYNAYCFVIGT